MTTDSIRILVVTVALLLASVPAWAETREEGDAPAYTRTVSDEALVWGPCPDFFPSGCQLAVLHGDPARPNADVFFRVPGGYDLPNHLHTSAERMVLVSGELHVAYAGQPTVVLRPGAYAYGPPGRPHDGRCASAEPCVLFIAFEEPVDATAIAKPAP